MYCPTREIFYDSYHNEGNGVAAEPHPIRKLPGVYFGYVKHSQTVPRLLFHIFKLKPYPGYSLAAI